MTVKDFIKWIKKTKPVPTSEIEFWYKGKPLEIESIGHFSVIRDVTVHFRRPKKVK